VFGDTTVTQHRYHCARRRIPFLRHKGRHFQIYSTEDCPGIDNTVSQHNFPIIDTLLSIPFSLLYNLPRLAGITPISTYQQLITMGSEIIRLWGWDPEPDLIQKCLEIRVQNIAAKRQEDARSAKPNPIDHQSRRGTTFFMKQPFTTYGTLPTHASSSKIDQDKCAVERPSGPIFLGTRTHLTWATDGTIQLTAGDKGLKKEDLQLVDDSIISGVTGSPVSSEVTEGSDGDDDKAVPAISCTLSLDDIASWCQRVGNSKPEPLLPLTPTSFERGIIASMSVNDILMVKGLMSHKSICVHPVLRFEFFLFGSAPLDLQIDIKLFQLTFFLRVYSFVNRDSRLM
jgi:hypothetical protein